MPPNNEQPWLTDGARIFRDTVRQFVERELTPRQSEWALQGRADTEVWAKAGKLGLLLPDLPVAYGGGGSFAYAAVVIEELARAGVHIGFGIQSIVAHYILAYGSPEQQLRWLPRLASGDLIAAIAMTEPGSGSDLQGIRTTARKSGNHYVLNGSKSFITNGRQAGLVCVAVRTDAKSGPKALSMVIVETAGLAGYRAGPPHDKVGRPAQEICDLYFDDVIVPAANLLGAGEGRGLFQMMDQLPYERLSIGLSAVVDAEQAVAITTQYVKDRTIYGKPLFDQQNTRFKLAECQTEARIGRVFIDHCIQQFINGDLDSVTAAMAKYWLTDCQGRIIDACVQLHGGAGYMRASPIARMWADARAQRIYAGSNEVMKDLVGWSL
jgi:acyl-CoA dehydrogenase